MLRSVAERVGDFAWRHRSPSRLKYTLFLWREEARRPPAYEIAWRRQAVVYRARRRARRRRRRRRRRAPRSEDVDGIIVDDNGRRAVILGRQEDVPLVMGWGSVGVGVRFGLRLGFELGLGLGLELGLGVGFGLGLG